MRLLMIEDDARYGTLLQHHVSCAWPEAEIVFHTPAVQGSLPPEFLAQGFDAVLLGSLTPPGGNLECLRDLTARNGFAPIIFLSDSAEAGEAAALGVHAVLGRSKIDPDRLVEAVTGAREKQAAARAQWRTRADSLEAQRFSGVFIPGYRRIRRLASGPVSELYLAESEAVGALVVIKIARDRVKENDLDHSFRRFLHEYEIVQRIHDPGVVRLYDLGMTDENAYLVMEYFRAGDLRTRMKSGLPVREALRIAAAVAHALHSVHAAGIVHRDLKPGNILLRGDGSIALIDFGLSKDAALAQEVTDHGMIFGTPHYMSPEQGHGEPIDRRSDLYSLGILLYEMLTREKPYVAENPMAIIYMHRKSPMPRLPASLEHLQPVLERLLAKQPDDRFATAAEAAEALESASRTLPSEEVPA